jgi:tetratricopeptide (TPR) repeat protein
MPRTTHWAGPILAILLSALLAGCESGGRTADGTPKSGGGGAVERGTDKLTVAEQASAEGEYQVALALFREILAEDPMETRAYLGIGDIFVHERDYRSAEPYYERASRIDPRNYRAQFSYGHVLQLLDRFVESARAYQRALALNPEGVEANLGLGATYLRMDEPEHAVSFAEKAVQLDPRNGQARASLGEVYEVSARVEEAIAQYLIALELLDDPRHVMRRLAEVLIAEERFVEAVNTTESLAKLDPSGSSFALLGRAQFKIGAYDDSLQSYRNATEQDGGDWGAWNGLGVNALNRWLLSAKADDGARLEARNAFRQSLRLNSSQQNVIVLMQKYGLQ